MRPLPVLAVVRAAYAFTFAHLGAIIAAIWLPMAVDIVVGFFVEQRFFAAAANTYAAHSAAGGGPALLLFPAYGILKLLLYAMMMTAVAGMAQGTRAAMRVPFSFGAMEWRLFRAWFGLALFLLVPILAFLLAASTLVPSDPSAMTQAQLSQLSLLVLVLAGGLIFVVLRFTFLLPGLVTGEAPEKGLLARAWTLSAGNFWRIFAIVVICVLPVYFCGGVLEAIAEMLVAPPQAAPADLSEVLQRSRETLPLTKGFQFLLAPFLIGLMASASVFAGRELGRTDLTV